ncbi:hypothetical protein GS462_11210 [Rhodococcus hoagii]|nr:hypothetical protein [Prescottella equi]MBM4650980.1 hypothetical protein [Prescottella equi]MBM4686673.1 hypothetical protein [Prescottella equi]
MRSTLYPELYVADLDVQFRGGVADVRSKPKLAALARIDGIEIDAKDDDAGSGSAAGDQSSTAASGSGDGGQSGAANGAAGGDGNTE